jgi:hypothetical protein
MTRQSLREDIRTLLKEALFGKPIVLDVGGKNYIGLVSSNTRPGELPYRITWFDGTSRANLTPIQPHLELSQDEADEIVNTGKLPETVRDKFWAIFGEKLGLTATDLASV